MKVVSGSTSTSISSRFAWCGRRASASSSPKSTTPSTTTTTSTSSGTKASIPTPIPTGCAGSAGSAINGQCCLHPIGWAKVNGQYVCVGEAIPVTASNFQSYVASFYSGQIPTSAFTTNGAMLTNAPDGLVWAGFGGAAMVAGYGLL